MLTGTHLSVLDSDGLTVPPAPDFCKDTQRSEHYQYLKSFRTSLWTNKLCISHRPRAAGWVRNDFSCIPLLLQIRHPMSITLFFSICICICGFSTGLSLNRGSLHILLNTRQRAEQFCRLACQLAHLQSAFESHQCPCPPALHVCAS